MGHAFLAPSSAHMWGAPGGCRAAPLVQAQYPEKEETPEQREGTAAHELAAVYIERTLRALPPAKELIGKAASNGEVFTQEMAEACEVYAGDVRKESIARGVFGGANTSIEQPVMLPRIHPLNGGTPDFWLHDRRNRTLILWDFKFGHDDVEAFENWQLMNYAALVLDKLDVSGATEQGYTVVLKVVQPRSYKKSGPVDSWTVPATDLRPYWNDLAQGAVESTSPNPVARPGRNCRNCSGRHACEALRFAAAAMMDYAKSVTTQSLPSAAAGLELVWLDDAKSIIEARKSGLEQELAERIKADEVIPYWGVKAGYGRSKWKDPQQAIGIGAAYGIDLRSSEPITPAQAKAAGLNADVVANFSYRPSTGPKLVRVKSNEARKVFTR